jgi:DNA polymerase II small subunit/DNA polymerase delta subunit B
MNIIDKYRILKDLKSEDIEALRKGRRNWIEYLVQAKKDNCDKRIIKHFRYRIDILSKVIAEKETEKEISEAIKEFEEKETGYTVSNIGCVRRKINYC